MGTISLTLNPILHRKINFDP